MIVSNLGMYPVTVSKWCTNTSQPNIETFIQIAKALNVSVDELLVKDKEDKK